MEYRGIHNKLFKREKRITSRFPKYLGSLCIFPGNILNEQEDLKVILVHYDWNEIMDLVVQLT